MFPPGCRGSFFPFVLLDGVVCGWVVMQGIKSLASWTLYSRVASPSVFCHFVFVVSSSVVLKNKGHWCHPDLVALLGPWFRQSLLVLLIPLGSADLSLS